MQNLAINIAKPLVLFMSFLIVSCATITVNVYFPAEEVRDAYSSLEEEFLEQPTDGSDAETSPDQVSPTPAPESRNIYQEEPTLSEKKVVVIKREINLDFSSYAWAQGNISQQITERLRSMPEVISSYKSRAKRQGVINKMLSDGKVAEGPQGLLVKKGALNSKEQQAFNAENKDRDIIMNGMAKAIVAINNLPETPENIKKVRPEAAKQFANFRRSER